MGILNEKRCKKHFIVLCKMSDKFILTKCKQGKILALSSCLFLIPSIYAYYNRLYFFSILLLMTTLISANYWRNAVESWRRDLDLVFSKISFFIVFCNGVHHVKYIPYLITGYIGMLCMVYFYCLSCKLYKKKNMNWYKYHFLFHVIVAYVQTIVVDSIL